MTLPGARPRIGHRHPLTQTAEELVDLFGRFGFAVARGPEVEDVRHNFEALNIPPSHPARDPVPRGITPCNLECSREEIDRRNPRSRQGVSERDRDRPRAGAHVRDAHLLLWPVAFQHRFY